MSRLRVNVNTKKCQTYKRCMAVAPAVFGLGADGKAAVLHPEGAPQDEVVKAARSCPYRAISVVAEDTGEQLFPPLPIPRNP
jgi:ferredoxin